MLKFINEDILTLYKANSNENINVAVFGHGFAFKCALRGIMEFSPSITWKIDIANTSITELGFDHRGWHVFRVNDKAHLVQ